MALRVDGRAHPSRGRSRAGDSTSSSKRRSKDRCFARRPALSRERPLSRGKTSARAPSLGRDVRGGLDGQTVIDGSSVSAFESPPVRQREVLLARVRLPLRAKSAGIEEGVRCEGSVGEGSSRLSRACSLGSEGSRVARHSRLSKESPISRYAQPTFFSREEGQISSPEEQSSRKRVVDGVDEAWGSVLAG
jgi:hypothetical protein